MNSLSETPIEVATRPWMVGGAIIILRVEISGLKSVHLIDAGIVWTSISRLENNCFAVMRSSSKEGPYLRLVDFCITQL